MLRDLIRDIIARSVAALAEAGELPTLELPVIEVERPKLPEHGDYATNIAMKLAAALRAAGQPKVNPRQLAETIAGHIRETAAVVPAYDLVESVEVEGAGFINLRLSPHWLLRQAGEVSRRATPWVRLRSARDSVSISNSSAPIRPAR